MFKPTKEEQDRHFQKIDKLETNIRIKKGRYGRIIGDTRSAISNLFREYENAIDEKKTKNMPEGLMEYLKNNELPSDLLFHAMWPEKYFEITHNKTSPYHVFYIAEMFMLNELIDEKTQYVNPHIVDIGCGDGIKVYMMLQEGIEKGKIKGTVDYLWLDDSQAMLDFAKKNFYERFYSKSMNKERNNYIASDDIDVTMKKVRPRFMKARFQEQKMKKILSARKPKTMMFLWGTFGNLGDFKQRFLEDIRKAMRKGDTFVMSYFRVLDNNLFDNPTNEQLMRNFFAEEKKRYEDFNVYHHEKEIDIKNFKGIMPWLDISPEDFDVHIELDDAQQMLYDVRTYKRDIVYHGEVVIPKWSYKSEGKKIDIASLKAQWKKEDPTKTMTESAYATKETDQFINEFLKFRGVEPSDCFINKEYRIEDRSLYITLEAKDKPITFQREEGGEKKSITKYPGEVITLHKSQRFMDGEMEDMIGKAWLEIVYETGFWSNLAGQDIMKMLVLKKK